MVRGVPELKDGEGEIVKTWSYPHAGTYVVKLEMANDQVKAASDTE